MVRTVEIILVLTLLAGVSFAQEEEREADLTPPPDCESLFHRFEQIHFRREYYEGGPVRLGDSWLRVKRKLGEPDSVKNETVDTYVYARPGCVVEIYFHNGRTESKSFRLLPARKVSSPASSSGEALQVSSSDCVPCLCVEGSTLKISLAELGTQ